MSDAQSLLDDANCLMCGLSPGMVPYAILAVINAINDGASVPTSANELMDAARCLSCTLSPGMVQYAILTALLQLGTSGGGSVQVYSGTGADPNVSGVVPDDPTQGAVYYQLASAGGTGTIWQWQSDTASWG